MRHGAEQPTEEDVVADGQNRGSNKDAERQTVGNDHAQQLSPRSDVELRVGIEDRHGSAEEQHTKKKKRSKKKPSLPVIAMIPSIKISKLKRKKKREISIVYVAVSSAKGRWKEG